jgi:catechol 2,3-dioxygenase-like lactoylglutathione lyase family enzyme
MVKTNGLDHVVLHASHTERSKEFYTQILDMSAYRQENEQVFLHSRQPGLAFFKKRGEILLTGGSGSNQLALTVATGNYPTRKAELEAQGGAASGCSGADYCIGFRDPDGHRLQLMVPA